MSTITDAPLPPFRAPQPTEPRRPWAGYLTTENVSHVGEWLRVLFVGKPLAICTVHEYRGWEPEIHAPVQIDEVNTRPDADRGVYAGIVGELGRAYVGFAAGDYVWGLWSCLSAQPRYYPGSYLTVPRGRPRDVLEYIDMVPRYRASARLSMDHRGTLTVEQATPEGLGWWMSMRALS